MFASLALVLLLTLPNPDFVRTQLGSPIPTPSWLHLHAAVGSAKQQAPLVVVLGDSVSACVAIPQACCFPELVVNAISLARSEVGMVVCATPGATVDDGIEALPTVQRLHPDFVVVELGANDLIRGRPIVAIRADLDLIAELIRLGGATPILMSVDVDESSALELGNPACEDPFQAATQVAPLTFRGLFLELLSEPEALAADHLHPNCRGHRIIASRLAPVLLERLP